MKKILHVPDALIYKLPDDDYIMCGSVMVSVYKNGFRIYGNSMLPALIYRTSLAQLILLVCIHNNQNKFNRDMISKILDVLHFKYKDTDLDIKENHIDAILDNTHNKFIQFINELIVHVLEAYQSMDQEHLEEYMEQYSTDLDDLRFEEGITLTHSMIMRAIISSILDAKDMNTYLEYEKYMLPMSEIQKLYNEPEAIERVKKIFGDENALSSDESCAFNQILVHHVFIDLAIILEGLIRDIVLGFNNKMINVPPIFRDLFSEYDLNWEPMERIHYTINKLLNLDDSEKCICVINGKLSKFLNNLFKQPSGN